MTCAFTLPSFIRFSCTRQPAASAFSMAVFSFSSIIQHLHSLPLLRQSRRRAERLVFCVQAAQFDVGGYLVVFQPSGLVSVSKALLLAYLALYAPLHLACAVLVIFFAIKHKLVVFRLQIIKLFVCIGTFRHTLYERIKSVALSAVCPT